MKKYSIKQTKDGWFRIARNNRCLKSIPSILGYKGWNLYRVKSGAEMDLKTFRKTGVL